MSSKSQRPTMQAIAERSGVSRTTVSLILGNRSDKIGRFKPETVQRVREVAKELGYRANLLALSLRSEHPSFFGLVLRGTLQADAISWHHQAFEGQLMAGVMEAACAAGLYPVTASQASLDAEGALQRITGLLEGGVFGAILRTPKPELVDVLQRQIEAGVPMSIVFPERAQQWSSNTIDMDNRLAGELAGKLLRDADCRHWLLIHPELMWEAIRLRAQSFAEAARQAGAELSTVGIPSNIGEDATAQWLAPHVSRIRPDGVFCASSVAGVGGLISCQIAGFRVPEDIRLVGCDASLWRAPGCPAITSVDVSWHDAGRLAVETMTQLRERGESVFEHIRLTPRLRKGQTCPGGQEDPAQVIAESAALYGTGTRTP